MRARVASSTDDVSGGSGGAPGGAKKRRVESANAHNDFITALHDFTQWSITARTAVELPREGDELLAALTRLSDEVAARQADVDEIRRLAARLTRGFQQRGEREDVLRKVERVEADHQDLRRLVTERRDTTEYLLDEAAFYQELRQLSRLVDQHLGWVDGCRPRPGNRLTVLRDCKVGTPPRRAAGRSERSPQRWRGQTTGREARMLYWGRSW